MRPLNHYAIITYKQDNNLQWLYIYLSILLPLIGRDKKGVGGSGAIVKKLSNAPDLVLLDMLISKIYVQVLAIAPK